VETKLRCVLILLGDDDDEIEMHECSRTSSLSEHAETNLRSVLILMGCMSMTKEIEMHEIMKLAQFRKSLTPLPFKGLFLLQKKLHATSSAMFSSAFVR
jgi:hypothetical protein